MGPILGDFRSAPTTDLCHMRLILGNLRPPASPNLRHMLPILGYFASPFTPGSSVARRVSMPSPSRARLMARLVLFRTLTGIDAGLRVS